MKFSLARKEFPGRTAGNLHFYGLGMRLDANCQRCPETASLLGQVPNLENGWFSILAPVITFRLTRARVTGSYVSTSDSSSPGTMTIAESAWLTRSCTGDEGKCIVFADYYEHEVWNETDEQRVVLFFAFDRPMRPLGRWLNWLLIAIAKRTSFVRRAKRHSIGQTPRPIAHPATLNRGDPGALQSKGVLRTGYGGYAFLAWRAASSHCAVCSLGNMSLRSTSESVCSSARKCR